MILKVLVTAVGGGIGQSVLRALKQSNLKYRVTGTDIDPWATGLYSCDSSYLIPQAKSNDYIPKILDICDREKINVVIPGSDPELSYLSEIKDVLKKRGILLITGSLKAVQICREKQASYAFFSPYNLPFIKTYMLSEQDQIKFLNYPLIVKPFDGSASQDVHVVFCKEELEAFKNNSFKKYIVQEYITSIGSEFNKNELQKVDVVNRGRIIQKDEISIQVLLDSTGIPFTYFSSRNSLKDGVPVTIDPFQDDDSIKKALEMAKMLGNVGMVGPCNFQCKISEKGPRFFEINPRFTGITAVRALLGFNEVEAMIRLLYYNEDVKQVKDLLNVNFELCCSRYITEYVFKRDYFSVLKKNGRVEAKGFSVSI